MDGVDAVPRRAAARAGGRRRLACSSAGRRPAARRRRLRAGGHRRGRATGSGSRPAPRSSTSPPGRSRPADAATSCERRARTSCCWSAAPTAATPRSLLHNAAALAQAARSRVPVVVAGNVDAARRGGRLLPRARRRRTSPRPTCCPQIGVARPAAGAGWRSARSSSGT